MNVGSTRMNRGRTCEGKIKIAPAWRWLLLLDIRRQIKLLFFSFMYKPRLGPYESDGTRIEKDQGDCEIATPDDVKLLSLSLE